MSNIKGSLSASQEMKASLSVGRVDVSTVVIVDDLINGGITKALSAEQGKVLNEKKASKEELSTVEKKIDNHILNHSESGGTSLTPEQEDNLNKIPTIVEEIKEIPLTKNRTKKLEDGQGNLALLETTEKTNLVGAINQVFQSVGNGKQLIATAITGKGVNADKNDTFTMLADKIGQIVVGEGGSGQSLELLYNFDNLIPGSAEGTLVFKSINALNDGEYSIHWADNGGAFADYEEIVKFNIVGSSATKTYEFINTNVIPVHATKIVAIKGGIIKASFIIPNSKKLMATKKYSFGLLSDTHSDGDGSDVADTIGDLSRAFTFFNNTEKTKMNIITGDVTRDGRPEDVAEYKRIRDTYSANTPVYLCRGNHDTLGGLTISIWEKDMDPSGLYWEKIIDGDVYLSLGMIAEDMASPFADYQLTWLEERMEVYKKQRVFLLEHVFVEPVGNVANLYPYDSLSNTIGTAGRRFRDVVAKYRNAIHFSGHSHLDFTLQRLSPLANCGIRTDTLCHRVHTPSGSTPRNNLPSTPDDLTNTFSDVAGSQGYVVDVYDNCIVLRGRDFTKGKFLPLAQYIIDTTPIDLVGPGEETEFPHIVDFTNFESGSLGSDGSVRPSSSSQVSDLVILNENPNKSFIFPKGISYIRIAYYDSAGTFLNIDSNPLDNEGSNTNEGTIINLTQPLTATQLRIKGQGPINAIMFDGALI